MALQKSRVNRPRRVCSGDELLMTKQGSVGLTNGCVPAWGVGFRQFQTRRGKGLADFVERNVMECRAAASIRLSPRELDHLAPLLGFLSDQLPEVSGPTRKHRAAEVSEPRFHVGIGESRIDLLVEL